MITTSEVAVSVTIDNNSCLAAIIKELEALGTVEVDSDQTIISIVGSEIASEKHLLEKIFASLNAIPIRMVSYGGSDNNISILVAADQKKQVLQEVNRGVFGL
jgi:aspartate kinase